MTWPVDLAVVLTGVVAALVCAHARVNRRVTRGAQYIVGGPETRIDTGEDQ